MIKQNLGYIISALSLIICLVLIYQKLSQDQFILNNTSSLATQRIPEELPQTVNSDSAQSQTIHTIQPGDTLWDLSVKYYGDGSKYPEIIKKNPGKTFKFINGREGLIYPGTDLEI